MSYLIFSCFTFLLFFAEAKTSTEYQILDKQIEVLTQDQKMQEALETLHTEIKTVPDPADRARILVKATQLEISLHEYEIAVKNLKNQSLPKDLKAQFLLSLYYAHTLMNYDGFLFSEFVVE